MTDQLAPEVNLNAPCPCGSGRKYKRCCWATRKAELARERHAVGEAATVVLRFTEQHFPGRLLQAEQAVLASLRERFDYRRLDAFLEKAGDHLFVNVVDTLLGDEPIADGRTAIELFLADPASASIHPAARAYLTAWAAASLSLYEVEQVMPGEGMVLKDLLNDRLLEVAERTASRRLEPWATLFFRVAEMEGGNRLTGGIYSVPREAVDWFRQRLDQDRGQPATATLAWPQYLKRRWVLVPQLWIELHLDPAVALPEPHVHGPGCGHEH